MCCLYAIVVTSGSFCFILFLIYVLIKNRLFIFIDNNIHIFLSVINDIGGSNFR